MCRTAVIVTGPRRAGKTTLLRRLFPAASYHLLEDPNLAARVRADPRLFVEEMRTRPAAAQLWFRSYLQTYLERDVRAVAAIRDLSAFRRFLALAATRNGQMLNRSELASPLGVSVPTISNWLSILEITSQILLVPPFCQCGPGKRAGRRARSPAKATIG